ncbi:hypothetical protein MMC28_000616 [Mycoblastus sanguinarius]|nr:hypothetical protein [Mycoblastus sanguinarius]
MAEKDYSKDFEDLSDFSSIPWCQDIIKDATFTPITNRIRPADPATNSRSFFERTLWTSDTIRACAVFHKGPIRTGEPSIPSGPSNIDAGAFNFENFDFGETRVLFSLGNGLNGIAGSAHGGLLAFLLDEVMGIPVYMQKPGMFVTAEMKLSYRRPVPTPGVILSRSWVDRVGEGRKIWVKGTIEDGKGAVLASSDSLFVKLREKM